MGKKVKQKFFKTAGGNGPDNSLDIATNDKRVFITGYVGGQTAVDFQGGIKDINGSLDIFVSGLDHCGNQKFFKTAGGINNDTSFSITANEKCTFITGFMTAPTGIDFNGQIKDLNGSSDIFVAGLDNKGCQKFFKTAGGPSVDLGGYTSIKNGCVSNEKHIFVTGSISGNTANDFKKKPINNLKNSNIFVARLDNKGCQSFFKTMGGINLFNPVVDLNKNNIFVSGTIFANVATDFKNNLIPSDKLPNNYNIFVAGLDHKGCQKFIKTAGGSTINQNVSIAVNERGVFITGYVIGPTGVDFNGKELDNIQGNGSIFVAGLDNKGCQKFFKIAGSKEENNGLGISVNDYGVYVTGFVSGQTGIDFSGNEIDFIGNSLSKDIFVAGLDYNGKQKFFEVAGNVANDAGRDIFANENGIYVTGTLSGLTALDFNGNEVENLQTTSIFVSKLDDCGGQKFFKTASGSSNGIMANGKNIFVTGNMSGNTGFDFNGKEKILQGVTDIFVAGLKDLSICNQAKRSKMPFV